MDEGTPLTLALQPGAGEGDGLGLGVGAGDGPVTVSGAVSFLLEPAHAGARSANVISTTGAQNSRFMLGRHCISAAKAGRSGPHLAWTSVIRLQVNIGKALVRGALSCNPSGTRARRPYTFDTERTIFSPRV